MPLFQESKLWQELIFLKKKTTGWANHFFHGQSDLDIRVSTLPTLYGESISLRLLNEKSQPLSMPELGLLPRDERNIGSVLEKPHGIVWLPVLQVQENLLH